MLCVFEILSKGWNLENGRGLGNDQRQAIQACCLGKLLEALTQRWYLMAWKPGMLQSMGSQRVGHDWATELTELNYYWRRFNPWVAKIPWRRKRQSTSVLLRGQSHVQRSLTGYSPWGQRKSDITEQEHEWHRITTENEHFVFLVLLKLPIYILCPLDLSFSYWFIGAFMLYRYSSCYNVKIC